MEPKKIISILIAASIIIVLISFSSANNEGSKIPETYKEYKIIQQPKNSTNAEGLNAMAVKDPAHDNYFVVIYMTGNQTFDLASWYHEKWHIDNPNTPKTKESELKAENYAAANVEGYAPLNNVTPNF